ncbi:MAG: hypothetical protein M9898_02170 [Chitinophagaceae bacterium]|nr:hypothetical protein [Chitinophagaceae bacterium]
MDNVFDTLKVNTFSAIAVTMGYDASWNGITARVLYNDPSVSEKVSEHGYDYQRPTLEYKEGDWPGMRELIEAKQDVIIEIKGKNYYALKIVGAVARDGDTYKVQLEEIV